MNRVLYISTRLCSGHVTVEYACRRIKRTTKIIMSGCECLGVNPYRFVRGSEESPSSLSAKNAVTSSGSEDVSGRARPAVHHRRKYSVVEYNDYGDPSVRPLGRELPSQSLTERDDIQRHQL